MSGSNLIYGSGPIQVKTLIVSNSGSNANITTTTLAGQQTYIFTPLTSNAVQTFTTDPWVTDVVIECYGAGGGAGAGNAGYSKSTLSGLTAPTTFKLWAGDLHEGGITRNNQTNYYNEIPPYTIVATGPSILAYDRLGIPNNYPSLNAFFLWTGGAANGLKPYGWGYATVNFDTC